MDILAGLNPAQKEAAEAIEGPLLILAGPGSGKTRVITHRVAYLVRVCGMSPRRILAVTFTNKAAREMEERLRGLLGAPSQELTLGTFHAFCARLLRADGSAIGVDRGFVIYDDEDQITLLKRVLQELNLDPKQYAPRAIQSAISSAKSRLVSPQEYPQLARSYFEEVISRVYRRYQELLFQSKALDFDDLLMQAVGLLRTQPQVLSKYQSRYLHVLVDEFQDTNLVQYEMAKLLAGKYRNLCVVGDPDQSIYSWRFADLRNILSFEKDYPEARVIYLEQNYRSTKTILRAAEEVIQANRERKPKKLWTENPLGLPIGVVETYNEQEEAQFVVAEAERLLGQGFRLRDCAVMYRTNAQSRALEEACLRYGVPYRLVGALRFYQRREVKDVLAYLRLLHNPYDSVSLARVINVPNRGIGQRTVEELSRWAQGKGIPLYAALQLVSSPGEAHPFAPRAAQCLGYFLALINELIAKAAELDLVSLFDLVLERAGYKDYLLEAPDGEERWENILELRGVAQQYRDLPPGEGLASFLEGASLVSDVDNLDEKADAVTLITLHQAKGLEFPVVFIVGLEEGLLPHIRSFDDPSQMEEERRLFYVGMTRARERLYLVRAFRRARMGASAAGLPSRFLEDIPRELVVSPAPKAEAVPPSLASAEPRRLPPGSTLKAGDRVLHPKFGEGVVVNCLEVPDDQEVTVAFKGGQGVKKLLLSFARLEKVN